MSFGKQNKLENEFIWRIALDFYDFCLFLFVIRLYYFLHQSGTPNIGAKSTEEKDRLGPVCCLLSFQRAFSLPHHIQKIVYGP